VTCLPPGELRKTRIKAPDDQTGCPGIGTGPVRHRAGRVIGSLALRPQPDDQLRRQLREEAPRQGVIDIPVDHADDISPPARCRTPTQPDRGPHLDNSAELRTSATTSPTSLASVCPGRGVRGGFRRVSDSVEVALRAGEVEIG
jgi:hypothetical protein